MSISQKFNILAIKIFSTKSWIVLNLRLSSLNSQTVQFRMNILHLLNSKNAVIPLAYLRGLYKIKFATFFCILRINKRNLSQQYQACSRKWRGPKDNLLSLLNLKANKNWITESLDPTIRKRGSNQVPLKSRTKLKRSKSLH